MTLVLSISISHSAFTNPNLSAPEPISHLTSTTTKKSFIDDLKESDRERLMRERKSALNKLFDKTNLQPIQDGMGITGNVEGSSQPGGSQSKRALLERMEKKKSNGGGEEEEEDEMNEIQLNLVCQYNPLSFCSRTRGVGSRTDYLGEVWETDSKATKNDANLPERDPPDSFSLNLRGCRSSISLSTQSSRI